MKKIACPFHEVPHSIVQYVQADKVGAAGQLARRRRSVYRNFVDFFIKTVYSRRVR